MRIRIIVYCIILTEVIFAQQFIPIQHDTTLYSHEVIFTGIGEISSTSLRNELTSKLILGGEITDQIKESTFSKQGIINRVGVDLNSEIEYRNMKLNFCKNKNLGVLVRMGYYALGSSAYSKDFFGIVFNGDLDYYGKTADISGTYFSFQTFQKIGFGLINKTTKSNVSLNYFNVDNYIGGYLNKGGLTQSEDGMNTSMDAHGIFRSTKGKSFIKGIGLGIDLDYRFSVEINGKNKSIFQIITKNIGVANYFSGLQTYLVDSTYKFDGFKLNQLYGDNSIFKDSIVLLDTLNIQKTIEKKTMILPGFLQFGKIVNENHSGKWQSFFGIRVYPSLAYTPLIYGGAHFSATKNIDLGSQVSIGGFSNLKIGLYSSFKINKWSIGIASQDLYGAISKKGFGQSLLFRVRCKM
jgi:hypothetical protein